MINETKVLWSIYLQVYPRAQPVLQQGVQRLLMAVLLHLLDAPMRLCMVEL